MTAELVVTGLVKSAGKKKILHGISCSVKAGEVVALLGPNGAGKTTCFYSIVGLVHADGGKIQLNGKNVSDWPMYRRARQGLGYLPQESSIFRGLTVAENIMGVLEVVEPSKLKRQQRLEELLGEFGLTKLADSPAPALSGGERRRVEIARALAANPQFMLLDEPFAGVDPVAVNDIKALIKQLAEKGLGVLITDHNVGATLSLVDRAYILHGGRVLTEGTPEQIVANDSVREVYLGKDFKL